MTCCTDDVIKLVQYDTQPSLQLVVYDALTSDTFDLSDGGTSAYFILHAKGAKAAKEIILCQKLPGIVNDDGSISYPPANSVPGSGGRVEVHWTGTALDTAGTFDGAVQVVWNDGTQQTTPDTVTVSVQPAWGVAPVGP